jgi:dUTP pyrophosphatase
LTIFNVQLLTKASKLPTKGTSGSAGWDLYATKDHLIVPGATEVINTGVAVSIPEGWCGLLTHRSSLAFRLDTTASLGVIDSDFRGEIKVKLFNHGTDGLRIKAGDKFAQMVIVPYCGQMRVVDTLDNTDRGAAGFGSTGVK